MTEYFVSGSVGSDTNLGTLEQPFKTIGACAKIVRGGDICYIREGIYRETVQPNNSGNPGNPIVFKAYQNEKVVVSGAEMITDQWQPHQGSIYKVKLDSTWDRGVGKNQVFLNGEMMIEARWPNINHAVKLTRNNHVISDAGSLDINSNSGDAYYEGSYSSSELTRFPDGFWQDGKISFVPGLEWWGKVGTVVSSTPRQVKFRFKWLNQDVARPTADDPFYLWGKYEALDAEKEWYFDVEGSQGIPYTLYLWSPGGTPNAKSVEMKTTDVILNLDDRLHITVEGISFFAGRISFNENSSQIILKQIESLYAYHNQFEGSKPAAIRIQGNNHQLVNSTIAKTGSTALGIAGTGHLIENNVIYDVGYISAASDGIQLQQSDRVEISQNTIFNTSSIGISNIGTGNRITNNHLFNIGLQKTDIAAINSWNSGDAGGTEIAYNLVHDVVAYSQNSHNGGKGIRLDSGRAPLGVSNYVIHHNIIYNTTSHNLVIWPLKKTHPNYGQSKNYLYNNTVEENIVLLSRSNASQAGTILKNNLAKEYAHGRTNDVPPGTVVENNLFVRSKIDRNLSGNPRFAKGVNPNFMLAANSPAIDAGVRISPYTDGFKGLAPDIGALESGSKPFVAGAVITEKDLSKISVNPDPLNTTQAIVSGMPVGRGLPDSFHIKVGDGTPSSNCANLTETTGFIKGICQFEAQDKTGNSEISISLDGKNFINIGQTIYLDVSSQRPALFRFSMAFSVLSSIALIILFHRQFIKRFTR
jgi:hypothetical protein